MKEATAAEILEAIHAVIVTLNLLVELNERGLTTSGKVRRILPVTMVQMEVEVS